MKITRLGILTLFATQVALTPHLVAGERPLAWQTVGEVAFETGMTPAEIMVHVVEATLEADPEAEIGFTVAVPTVTHGVVSSDDLSGLPVEDRGSEGAFDRRGAKITEMLVSVPFEASDFMHEGQFDAARLLLEVDGILSGLASRSKSGPAKDHRTQDFTNAPDCGGYPINSTVTSTSSSCVFGTTVSRYVCLPNAEGGKDWFLTSQDFYPPQADCLDP